jgi:hypothetical protein
MRVLRFEQTVGDLRVPWSHIDVAVVGRTVTSIRATTVPLAGRRLLGDRRISAERAGAIARRAIRHSQSALPAQAVAYAGSPSEPRAPRRAWVVQVAAGVRSDGDESAERTICVVVDAQSGRILSRWEGKAAAPQPADRGRHLAGVDPVIGAIFDGSGANGPGAPWALLSDPDPFTPEHFHIDYLPTNNQSEPGLLNVTLGVFATTRFFCHQRGFCGRDGGSNGQYVPVEVIGRSGSPSASFYSSSTKRIEIKPSQSDDWDAVAHEFGHLIDFTRAHDRKVVSGPGMDDEVQEALGDMFAFDYDRDDPTMFDDAEMKVNFPGDKVYGGSRDLANPGRFTNSKVASIPLPYPSTMCGYKGAASDEHFNATILGHAYYLFVDEVGHDKAGAVLQLVPGTLPPTPTFESVRAAFVLRAGELYGDSVRTAAVKAFDAVRVGPGISPCPGPPKPPSQHPCHQTPDGVECDPGPDTPPTRAPGPTG